MATLTCCSGCVLVLMLSMLYYPVSAGSISGTNSLLNFSEEFRLNDNLMKSYNKNVRPVNHHSDVLNVTFSISALQTFYLDLGNNIFQMNIWNHQSWNDVQLKWNPADYDNINETRIPIDQLWSPDITLYNDAGSAIHDSLALVKHTGEVRYTPNMQIMAYCTFNAWTYVFGAQECTLRFVSLAYDGKQVAVTFLVPGGVHNTETVFSEEQLWSLQSITGAIQDFLYAFSPEPYYLITYKLSFVHSSAHYIPVFIVPAILLSIVVPAIFLLPPSSKEKITLGVGLLVSMTVLQSMLVENLPGFLNSVIAQYYLVNIGLLSVSLVLTAFTQNMWHNSRTYKPLPRCLQVVFVYCLSRLLCVEHERHRYDAPTSQLQDITHHHNGGVDDDNDQSAIVTSVIPGPTIVDEWAIAAKVIDRLFCVCSVIIITLTLMILLPRMT